MKKRIVFGILLVVTAGLAIAGGRRQSSREPEPQMPLVSGEEATSDPSIVFNRDKKEVSIIAEVNGKYFTEPTRHGVVYRAGSNGEKAVLRALGDEKVFYETMVLVGFVPSNKLAIADMSKGVNVEGEALDVFVSWDGQEEIPFANIIRASEERPMDVRFGGNIANANTANTGCVLCLDSCAVGITSNSSYETGASNRINFYGRSDVLPADGTRVKVTFRPRS